VLANVGDAAVSFLKNEDEFTTAISLADRENIDNLWINPGARAWKPRAQAWNPPTKKWFAAVSKKMYFGTLAA
jgi:hypothetical protein